MAIATSIRAVSSTVRDSPQPKGMKVSLSANLIAFISPVSYAVSTKRVVQTSTENSTSQAASLMM